MSLGKGLRTRRGGSGAELGGDACVALVLIPRAPASSCQGDASVPSYGYAIPFPQITYPCKAGVDDAWSGDALCCASPSSCSRECLPQYSRFSKISGCLMSLSGHNNVVKMM